MDISVNLVLFLVSKKSSILGQNKYLANKNVRKALMENSITKKENAYMMF